MASDLFPWVVTLVVIYEARPKEVHWQLAAEAGGGGRAAHFSDVEPVTALGSRAGRDGVVLGCHHSSVEKDTNRLNKREAKCK